MGLKPGSGRDVNRPARARKAKVARISEKSLGGPRRGRRDEGGRPGLNIFILDTAFLRKPRPPAIGGDPDGRVTGREHIYCRPRFQIGWSGRKNLANVVAGWRAEPLASASSPRLGWRLRVGLTRPNPAIPVPKTRGIRIGRRSRVGIGISGSGDPHPSAGISS